MALDLRLQQKMVQQLVMTPQLQQAIKLLQLSHLEMAEVLREEMEQNPVLEERSEGHDDIPSPDEGSFDAELSGEAQEALRGAEENMGLDPVPASPEPGDGGGEGDTSGELAADMGSVLDAPVDATPEPTSSDVEREIDWEAYLDSHSYALPGSSAAGGEELPPFEATLTKPTSLVEHLRWQVQMAGFPPDDAQIALMLVEELNDDGYLAADAVENIAEELGVSQDAVENMVLELQELDPVGVGARNLRECLLLQARRLSSENPLVADIIDKHLPNVERRNFGAIAKDLKVSVEAVAAAVKVITQLEPRPGRVYSDREPQYITPDIFVYKVGDDYIIMLNEDGLPRLRISNYYRDALQSAGGQTKSYIQEKLRSAAWLIRSIHMRQRTIYRVMESILKFQRDFFDKGVAYLKPLILKDVAEDVGMHESTISRVTTNKYVHTPQGIYELKYFFNSSISRMDGDSIASESVRNHIQRLIGEEDPRAPYSDQRIVEILKAQDIDIARRTVAKYREMLKIPSSSKRKRVF